MDGMSGGLATMTREQLLAEKEQCEQGILWASIAYDNYNRMVAEQEPYQRWKAEIEAELRRREEQVA